VASRPASGVGAVVYPIKLLVSDSRNKHQIKSWRKSFQNLLYEGNRNKWHQRCPIVSPVVPVLIPGSGSLPAASSIGC